MNVLIKDIQRNCSDGIGKPLPLRKRHYWSHRITREHHLFYTIKDGTILIGPVSLPLLVFS
ncbi:type II toxin-antitoxin system YoeB family toxin [Rothia endophytica]|uniref:type II toxin-antitoxin system YoeB family toxin n=1 Tax=Rothia TaxID=32207 RepID=UPI00301499B8